MEKKSEQLEENGNPIYACGLSGLLLGLSVPCFAFAPLGFLAWAWMLPLLYELRRTEKFAAFIGRVLIAVGIGFSMITLWVVNASVYGFLASTLMGTFVWTIPFVWFYFARRYFNWKIALFSLPFFWTAWEWLYHLTPFSFGAVRLGYTQSDLLWLIQYADLTGVEGVTFWLVAVNAAAFFVIYERKGDRETRRRGDEEKRRMGENTRHAKFRFFFSPHLLFSSSPFLLSSSFPILLFSLFALPLGYAAFVFLKPQSPEKVISIAAVQPNISPLGDYSEKNLPNIFGKQLALTDKILKTDAPDLIVWNEVAVPYILSDDAAANNYLAKQLKKWNTPVLTGLIEVKNYAKDEPRPLLLAAQNRGREFFNASALFTPNQIQDGKLPVNLSEMYLKRRLMPFLEHVPLSDEYPLLADLIIPIGTRPRLSYGATAKIFEFQTKSGESVKIGTMICYENLYPEMSADSVREGAEVLAAITNEGFFAGSQGQYQLAAFSRFRSIETRRAVVRAAATGITRTTDKFGRITAEVPVWSEQILRTKIAVSNEQTIYVCFGDWLPKLCLLTICLLIAGMFRKLIYNLLEN